MGGLLNIDERPDLFRHARNLTPVSSHRKTRQYEDDGRGGDESWRARHEAPRCLFLVPGWRRCLRGSARFLEVVVQVTLSHRASPLGLVHGAVETRNGRNGSSGTDRVLLFSKSDLDTM